MTGLLTARRSSVLEDRPFRAATRAWSCWKMFMVPSIVFILLAMGRVMRELRISGNAAMDNARRRVRNKDAAGDMNDWCSNMSTLQNFMAHYICSGDREHGGHTALKCNNE